MKLNREDVERIYSLYFNGLRFSLESRLLINSPFRDETKPSFELSLVDGLWYDYGTGQGGDVVSFVALIEEISIPEALSKLKALQNHDPYLTTVRPKVVSGQQTLSKVSKLPTYEVSWLYGHFCGVPDVLSKRGITEDVMSKYGVYSFKEDGYDVVLVATQVEHNIVTEYKRFKYMEDGKHTLTKGKASLFPTISLTKKNLILCEGELDALAVLAAGYNAITGTSGANTFPDYWKYALAKKNILILYDNDKSGRNGTERVATTLHGWSNSVIKFNWDAQYKEKYDISDYLSEGKTILNLLGEHYEAKFRDQNLD